MPNKTTHAFGNKADFDAALEAGTINAFDEVFFNDTGETGWVNKEGNFVLSTPRTQKSYTLNGTSLGALADGSTIPAGKSLDEIMAMATQKAVAPKYTAPTVAIANNAGTAPAAVEAGTSINVKLRATFTKNDAGNLTAFKILKGTEEVATGSATQLDYTAEAPIVIGDETISFKANAAWADGPVKNNNLNQPDNRGQIKAGNKDSSTVNFVGQRKSFWGAGVGAAPETITSDVVRGLPNSKLNIANGVTKLSVAAGSRYIMFAVPTGKRVTAVKYVEGNDPNMLANFESSTVQVADARGAQNGLKAYTVLLYKMASDSTATMTFEFTIA